MCPTIGCFPIQLPPLCTKSAGGRLQLHPTIPTRTNALQNEWMVSYLTMFLILWVFQKWLSLRSMIGSTIGSTIGLDIVGLCLAICEFLFIPFKISVNWVVVLVFVLFFFVTKRKKSGGGEWGVRGLRPNVNWDWLFERRPSYQAELFHLTHAHALKCLLVI